MAGGGRTYYSTPSGRFSKGSEVREHDAAVAEATRRGELQIAKDFGATLKDPTGSMSREQLLKVLRSGDTIKFGDGTSVKVTAANKLAVVNKLVTQGKAPPLTPAGPAPRPPLLPRGVPAPTQTPKPAPRQAPRQGQRGQPKPTPRSRTTTTRSRTTSRSKPTRATRQSTRTRTRSTAQKTQRQAGQKTKAPQRQAGRPSSGRTKGGRGLISGAGVVVTGNRRKGGGGKKDRKRGRAKPRQRNRKKGGRTGRGRSR